MYLDLQLSCALQLPAQLCFFLTFMSQVSDLLHSLKSLPALACFHSLILTLELLTLSHHASQRTQTDTQGSLAPKNTSEDRAYWAFPREAGPHIESPQQETLRQWTLSCWLGRVTGRGTPGTSTILALPLENCAFGGLRLLEMKNYLGRWCQYFSS